MRIRAIKRSGEASSNHVSRPTSEPREPSKRSKAIWANRASNEAIQLPSQLASQSANQPTNQQTNKPTNLPTNQPTNILNSSQPSNKPTNHRAHLPNYLQCKGLRPPCLRKLIVRKGREGSTLRCFKWAKNRIWLSWDSQFSQTVYLSLQLQNHMGFRFGSSWGVVDQILKSHW